jgi:hypothetical protein
MTAPAMAADVLLFESGKPAGGLAFHAIDDRVMGGRSQSRMSLSAAGHLVFEGQVTLAGGGFASVRSTPLAASLAGTRGLCMTLRGDGKRYKLSLRMGDGFDGIQYQGAFVAPEGKWAEVEIPFEAFAPVLRGRSVPDAPPLEAGAVRSLGFVIADRQGGPFRMEVKRIVACRSGGGGEGRGESR